MDEDREETEDKQFVFFPAQREDLSKASFFGEPDQAVYYVIAK